MIRPIAASLAAILTTAAGLAATGFHSSYAHATETAQVAQAAFELDLGGFRFDPLVSVPTSSRASVGSGPDLRLVQFSGPIRPEWLSNLAHDGVKVLQYVHPYSYVVWSDSATLSRSAARPEVRWSGDFIAEYRVTPHHRAFDDSQRPTMALVSRHADKDALNQALAAVGATVDFIDPVNSHFSVAQFTVAGDRYLDVGSIPGVYAVQDIEPLTEEQMFRGEMSNQSVVGAYGPAPNYTITPGYETWLTNAGYDGTGVIVGIVDGGTLLTHQDLVGQGSPCVSAGGGSSTCAPGTSPHGTHVGAAVAGTGASNTQLNGFLRGQGTGPGAKIVSQRYDPFTGGGPGGMVANGMLTIYRESALSSAILTNNSWGPTNTPQGYDIPTQQVDIIARDALADVAGQQPVLPVWSIMNGNGDSNGACAPSSVASPDEAKNLFAVGSTSMQNTSGTQLAGILNVSSNSAHGNACDGRRIPHIVAPGCNTDSATNSPTAYTFLCGTSMASPVVSGAVAVFIEKYRDENSGDTPSPALVKAAFTAAAQNLQGFQNADGGTMGHRPDRFQGYGRLDLDAVINHAEPVYFVDQEEVFTASAQSWTQTVMAADPAQPIRIMLAWSDAPGHGMGGTTPAWVNNLDLTVTAGSGTYRGNVIGGDGWSATGGSADDRNNLEGVFLSAAQHGGVVSINVNATNIAADALNPHAPGAPAQDFALACYNCVTGPGFSLSASPASASICAPADANTTVSVNASGGFVSPVTLSASSLPGSATASFAPAVVNPTPGSSALTIGNTGTVTAGSYAILIEGTDGTETKSTNFNLSVATAAPTAPALTTPATGATNVSTTPTLEWSAVAGATDYLVEVASDPGFATIVFSTTTASTSATVAPALNTSGSYHWRVTANNACGTDVSAVSTFRTLSAPGDCAVDQTAVNLLSEDFSGGLGSFATTGSTGAQTWAIAASPPAGSPSAGNAVLAVNLATVSDQRLISPAVTLPTDQLPLSLQFWNHQALESRTGGCWDGGILEVTTNAGGTWTQVTGAAILNRAYDGPIGSGWSNPLIGLNAWCGNVRPWENYIIDLNAYAGQTVQFRWRLGTDSSVGLPGWHLDDIKVQACEAKTKDDTIFADGFEGTP